MTTLVVGAGFAGLTAACTLQQGGQQVTVLEARDRIGGRAYTNREFAGIPVEFGAELIHGSNVSTWEWVHKLGLRTLHWQKRDDSMVRLQDGRWLTIAEARQASPEFNLTRSWDLPDVPVAEGDEDLASYLTRIGFTEQQLCYVRRSFANAVGDDMRYISAQAVLNKLRDTEHEISSDDYRILDGYDSIYNTLAEGLNICLETVVQSIQWGDSDVVITTNQGEFRGENAVITLPLGVLQSGKVQFEPGLSAEKQEGLAGVRMGPVMKMVYEFDAPIIDRQIGAIYSRLNPPMWWSPSLGRDEDVHVWTAFFSGDWAREMLALGEEKMLAKGLETLRTELGRPDLQYTQAQVVKWPEDPYAMGGYSVTMPGQLDARQKLANATPPLYWAGEATAPQHMAATIHGAHFTGQRAADEILNHK